MLLSIMIVENQKSIVYVCMHVFKVSVYLFVLSVCMLIHAYLL